MHMCCGFRRAVSPAVKKTDDHRSFVNDKILKHHKRRTMIYSNDKEQREMHAIPGGSVVFMCRLRLIGGLSILPKRFDGPQMDTFLVFRSLISSQSRWISSTSNVYLTDSSGSWRLSPGAKRWEPVTLSTWPINMLERSDCIKIFKFSPGSYWNQLFD